MTGLCWKYKYWNIFNFYDVYSIFTKLIENQYILSNYISFYLGTPFPHLPIEMISSFPWDNQIIFLSQILMSGANFYYYVVLLFEQERRQAAGRTSDPQIKSNEDRICRGEPQPNLILFSCECWQAKFFFHNSLFKSLPQFYYLHSRLSWEDVGCCCSTTFAVTKVKFGFDESGCRPS